MNYLFVCLFAGFEEKKKYSMLNRLEILKQLPLNVLKGELNLLYYFMKKNKCIKKMYKNLDRFIHFILFFFHIHIQLILIFCTFQKSFWMSSINISKKRWNNIIS